MRRGRLISGLVLISLGAVLLVVQQTDIGGRAVVAAIGVAFLVAYALTRNYGFLVPGGIMTGLGLGIIYASRVDDGGPAVLFGLGIGFLSVYLIDVAARRAPGGWWPLIPGGVLSLIGLLRAADQTGFLGTLGRWWPIVLILVGLYILVQRRTTEPKV